MPRTRTTPDFNAHSVLRSRWRDSTTARKYGGGCQVGSYAAATRRFGSDIMPVECGPLCRELYRAAGGRHRINIRKKDVI